MTTLYITKAFYEKFQNNSDALRVIQTYGYQDKDKFFSEIIAVLNNKYGFNINKLVTMEPIEANLYGMYNGYIYGETGKYKEILVSFSDPYTKEGNTIISQQLMPMLRQKIGGDPGFLYDDKIKRIFILTSHKAVQFDKTKNAIKDDNYGSTLQLLVKCLVTLNFDVIPFIPILNLDINKKFNNVQELVDNIDYIRTLNQGNLQHKQITIVGNTVTGSFSQAPKGQDEKYFALRYLTAIYLNHHNKYDVSQAYSISGHSAMMEMLHNYAQFINKHDIIANSYKTLSDEEFKELIKTQDEFIERLKSLAQKYGESGTRVVNSVVRLSEVQDELRKRLIKAHECKCLLCNITNEELLIASHIKDSNTCDIYGKADLENAFLLCAIHDKLFDKKLISFDFQSGKIMISNKLTADERHLCNLDENYILPSELLTQKRREYLKHHNEEFNKKNNS